MLQIMLLVIISKTSCNMLLISRVVTCTFTDIISSSSSEFLCCLTTPGLSKDIQRQTQHLRM